MEALGIDLKLLIAQAVNFIIVMLVLWKFAYNPILAMLDERRKKVEQGITDSEKASKSLGKAEIEAGKIREKAYQEANEILKNAKDEANMEAAQLIKKSSEQADRIIANAKEEATLTKNNALKEARKEITQVVAIALDKIVEENLTSDEKAKLTKSSLAEL